MKIFRFDQEVGKSIKQFDSDFVMSRIVQTSESAHINCMHLDAGGVVGHHQAVVPQLFLVVSGNGKVRGADHEWTFIEAGEAAFWKKGEWHETSTDEGLTAIVIETPTLDPEKTMPLKLQR